MSEIKAPEIKIPWEAWVVVCDGAKALVLQNAGDFRLLDLKVRESLTHPDIADRDAGADKPGQSHSPNGIVGSAIEETGWQDRAEEDFLKEVAELIDHLVQARNATSVILVAAPRALGVLRAHLSQIGRASCRERV